MSEKVSLKNPYDRYLTKFLSNLSYLWPAATVCPMPASAQSFLIKAHNTHNQYTHGKVRAVQEELSKARTRIAEAFPAGDRPKGAPHIDLSTEYDLSGSKPPRSLLRMHLAKDSIYVSLIPSKMYDYDQLNNLVEIVAVLLEGKDKKSVYNLGKVISPALIARVEAQR